MKLHFIKHGFNHQAYVVRCSSFRSCKVIFLVFSLFHDWNQAGNDSVAKMKQIFIMKAKKIGLNIGSW